MEMSHREQMEVLRATMYSLVDSIANNQGDEPLRRQQQQQLQGLISEIIRIDTLHVAEVPAAAAAEVPAPAPRPFGADVDDAEIDQLDAHIAAAAASVDSAPAPAPAARSAFALFVPAALPVVHVARPFVGFGRAPAVPGPLFAFGQAPAPAPPAVPAAPAPDARQLGALFAGPVVAFGQAPAAAAAAPPNPFARLGFGFAFGAPRPAPAYSAAVLDYARSSHIRPERAAAILAYAARVGVHPDRAVAHARAYRAARDARHAREARDRRDAANKVVKQTKVIKIADLAVVNADSCAICMENHSKGDEVVTNCGHHFGTTCFAQWETAQVSKQSPVSCPCCRVKIVQVTGFRRRAAPKSAAAKK